MDLPPILLLFCTLRLYNAHGKEPLRLTLSISLQTSQRIPPGEAPALYIHPSFSLQHAIVF